MKEKNLKLSVRKMRDYKRTQREIAERNAKLKYYETLGTMDTEKIVDTLANQMLQVLQTTKLTSDSISRAAINKLKTLIPKSPRGRKPLSHTA